MLKHQFYQDSEQVQDLTLKEFNSKKESGMGIHMQVSASFYWNVINVFLKQQKKMLNDMKLNFPVPALKHQYSC